MKRIVKKKNVVDDDVVIGYFGRLKLPEKDTLHFAYSPQKWFVFASSLKHPSMPSTFHSVLYFLHRRPNRFNTLLGFFFIFFYSFHFNTIIRIVFFFFCPPSPQECRMTEIRQWQKTTTANTRTLNVRCASLELNVSKWAKLLIRIAQLMKYEYFVLISSIFSICFSRVR